MESTLNEKICHACGETLYDGNPIKSFTKCRHTLHERCLSSDSTTTTKAPCPVCLKTVAPVLAPAQPETPRDNNNSFRFRSIVDLSTDSIQNNPEGISFPPSSPKPQSFRSIVQQNTTYSFHSASSNDTFAPNVSTDVWQCPKCTYENKRHTDLCYICRTGRRPFELSPNLSNQSFNPTSRSVSSKQETNSQSPEISSSVWSCTRCTYENPETNETCEICENSKEVFPKPNWSYNVDTNARIEVKSSEPESEDKTESFSISLVRENPEAYDREKDCQQKQNVPNNRRQSTDSPEVSFQRPLSPVHGELQLDDNQSSTITNNENENSAREQAEVSSKEGVRTNIVDHTYENKVPSVLINQPSEPRTQYRVFIPNLPMLGSDDALQEILCQRLKSLNLSGSYEIRCYSSIGIAMIDVRTKHEHDHLIEKVRSIVFDPQKDLIVHFVGDFQSDSFLILLGDQQEKISTKDLLDRWQTILKVSISVSCDMISIDYPNIFKLTFPNFSEFLRTLHSDSFTFKNQIVRIYHRTSASFFDDLPPNITQNDIVTAIHTQLNRPLNPPPIYVQFHPKTSTAVVIVSDSIVEWSQTKQIFLNNKAYQKRQKLNLRLVISSFPADLSVDAVKQNVLFENRIIDSKQVGNRLILELDDQSIYEKCTQVGGFFVDGQLLRLQAFGEIHTETQNREMIVKRWYEQDMNRHKVDLKDFLGDLGKPFFKCCWNPKTWLEQFLPVFGVKDKESDNRRRLLRLTVMTDTIKVVNENRYQIENDGKSEDVQLNASKMKSIIYNNRSKLHSQREMSKSFDRPFPQTKVKVINKDCLLVYNDLVRKNKSPLLLNMANAETPGGGYRQGAGAQEENVFRRSNYHLSLDIEMDTKNEAERHLKTDNCDLKQVNRSEKIYPISEFGAIYTSGITVFRDTEENGYAYLPQPWIDVCAIAVAAYNRPDLHTDQQSITDKMAIGTRKKIENLFAIAHLHTHDCLVLSALGCGAFRNPPEHVVSIFQSVIEQFAGFFDEIHFAIVDDHNTGGSWNPKGNFAPFTRLDNFIAKPSDSDLEANMIVGPFLILETKADRIKVNDVKIVDAPLCQHGGHCHNQHDVEHNRKFAHPPLCSNYQKCQRFKDDKVHASSFIHRIECREGGMCKSMKDPQHQGRYTHPDFCADQGNCENTKTEHLKKFCHVPVCSKGMTCTEHLKKSTNHCQQYRHIQLPCPYQSKCAHFHDQEHFTNYRHPFRQPCPLTPYTCEFYQLYLDQCTNRSKTKDQEIEQHCLSFSHVCPFGRNCHNDDDPSHLETSIHVHRLICPEKDKCSKLTDEEHLNSYTHPNIRDIRHLCHQSGAKCRDRWDRDHIKKYRHSGNSNHIGVAHYGALNIDTNFIRNHHKSADAVQKYAKNHKWAQPTSHVKEITDWIRSLQPVHRCNKLIFESILVHGHVMSRSYMDKLRNLRFVASAVNQHPQVRQIIDHHKNSALTQAAREYLQAFVAVEFDVHNATPPIGPMGLGTTMPVSSSPSPSPASTSDDIDERKKALTTAESKIKPYIKESDLNKIRDQAKMIVDASIKLNTNKAGIGYKPDEDLGTNEQIFSIFGPHRGHYYGDIVIVFKREIMYHPDANFSVQAATSFGPSGNAYKWRPWLTNPGNPKDRIQHYHWTKLHCAVPDYDYAAALELMALTSLDLKKDTLNVTLDQVKQHWMHVDSHSVFESHLPQLVPLDYVDHVYIPKNIFDSLSTVQQGAARENFGVNLTITDHVVDMNNPHNVDAARTDYQKHVLDKINRQITQNRPQEHYGFTVTLPASGLKQYVIMPMTILQSSYRHGASNDAIDTIYIYWQALGGDMTLALSKHEIVADEDQSKNESLLCYIADMAKVNPDHHYHEPYSYLTVGYPLSHDILIGDANLLKEKSNCFHRGCNTHDFITYCLILKRKIGQVVLLHVGSNGIYNHQKLVHNFRRDEIDLAALDYVQMSANNHPIPIRNLIIGHEPIDEFHTSFDRTSTSDQKADANPKPVATHPDKPQKDDKKSMFQDLWNVAKDAFRGAKDKKERKPCSESVNCLLQYCSYRCDGHNKQYSHPCRYSEMCRSPNDHPHLEHIPHRVPTCKYNQTCRELTDPIHRAQYRHTGLADFLIPCRYEKRCRDTQPEHRQRYSHGENVLVFISSAKRSNIDDSDARSD